MEKEIQVSIRVRCDGCCGAFDRMWHSEEQEDRTQGIGPVLGTIGNRKEFNWS